MSIYLYNHLKGRLNTRLILRNLKFTICLFNLRQEMQRLYSVSIHLSEVQLVIVALSINVVLKHNMWVIFYFDRAVRDAKRDRVIRSDFSLPVI